MNQATDRGQTGPSNRIQTSSFGSSNPPSSIFLTGGTGFLGKRLLLWLATWPDTTVYVLCRKGAEARLNKLLASTPGLSAKLRVVHGDITLPGLGIDGEVVDALNRNRIDVFHCAAVYNLAVDEETAHRVNTKGTRNVLDFAASLPALRRFHHISTIIVSGDRTGKIYENELDKGQGFKNNYEYSKFHAEKVIIQYSDQIPATIYRPAIIIGDSRDGCADKFDGLYFGLGLMVRGLLPMLIPGAGRVPLHVVPVDFVAEAIADIARHDDTIGKTFHVCDPNPAPIGELIYQAKEMLQGRAQVLHIPVSVMRAIAALPFFSSLAKMPAQIIPYMYQETAYDMTNTAEVLQRSGIVCPPIEKYFEKVVRFFEVNYGRPPDD
jgi:thioester reductase-like protein